MKNNNKYYQTLFLILFFLLTAYNLLLNATVRFVSKSGNSTPPYITWETAADRIQKCINISVFGDTIYVANGVYEEQVVMIDGLSLIGAGTDSCIVDSRSFPLTNNRTITMQNACLVKGFYIRTSNNLYYGIGIYTEGQTGLITENKFSIANTGIDLFGSSITVYNNYFFNIKFGIGVLNSNSLVRRNLIIMNVDGVEGIRVEAFTDNYTPVIDSNYIDNVYDTGIYKFIGSSPTIKNNVINVKYDTGISIAQAGNVQVFNNLIHNAGYAGIDNFITSNVTVNNNYIIGKPISYGIKVTPTCVIKNNVVTNAGTGIGKYGTINPVVQYNNSWNNNTNYENGINPDTTNLSVDPMVMNDDSTQGKLDFHFQMFSPLIDAGDPTILDRDGSRSDIGLYGGPYGWTYTYQDLAPRPPHNVNQDGSTERRNPFNLSEFLLYPMQQYFWRKHNHFL